LKPEKLFLTNATGQEQLKLLDLGSGHEQHASSHRVPTVNTGGVPLYMSPEQMRGAAEIDARTDIWSLGCVLFEMLSGTPLFLHTSLAQACVAVLERPTPSLRDRFCASAGPGRSTCPEIPVALEEVVLRCLQKKPTQRFDNVAELAWALLPFAPSDAHVHVVRCTHIFEEHGLVSRQRVARATPAQLDLHAAAADALAPANARAWPSELGASMVPFSGPVEDTLRVEASRAAPSLTIATHRLDLISGWRTVLAILLFVLGCVLSLHPSPRAARQAAARATRTGLKGRTPVREPNSGVFSSDGSASSPSWSEHRGVHCDGLSSSACLPER
jgi:hypothetical protein